MTPTLELATVCGLVDKVLDPLDASDEGKLEIKFDRLFGEADGVEVTCKSYLYSDINDALEWCVSVTL